MKKCCIDQEVLNTNSVNSEAFWEISTGETIERELKKIGVTVSKPVLALIAIIFNLLVKVFPDLLQWIIDCTS